MNPIPHFWEIECNAWLNLREVEADLKQLGFIINKKSHDNYVVGHVSPGRMAMWILQKGDFLAEKNISIREYFHNTKRRRKKS